MQGLGCMSLTTGFYARPEGYTDEDAIAVLKRAFGLGITLLNTADFGYGNNEEVIGELSDVCFEAPFTVSSKLGVAKLHTCSRPHTSQVCGGIRFHLFLLEINNKAYVTMICMPIQICVQEKLSRGYLEIKSSSQTNGVPQ